MTYKIIPTAVFMNGSRIDAIEEVPTEKIGDMMWGTPDVLTFYTPREVAYIFHTCKSAKPALAFFAGVEYVHVSKAARLLIKHRERIKRKRITYHTSTRDKKRDRRASRQLARQCLRAGMPERAAVWRWRARAGLAF